MERERREELNGIMAGLAAGDPAMLFALLDRFGDDVRSALMWFCKEEGIVKPTGSDLDGLVVDACDELRRVARSWRPEGALPWRWARLRLVSLLRRHAGPARVRFNPWRHAPPTPPPAAPDDDRPPMDVLAPLAARRADLQLVVDALELVVPARDRSPFLRHLEQSTSGDPSPARTVATEFGRSPAGVRQLVHRARMRLCQLAVADDRFRPLLDLPLLGPIAGEEAA
ncbi:MAG: hypothetical protein ACRD0G_05480 [Acidimicrobiales bacterium]